MKTIFITIILCIAAFQVVGQVPDHIVCDSAKKMCEAGDEHFNFEGNEEYCTQPLYYYFHYDIDAPNYVGLQSLGSGGTMSLYYLTNSSFSPNVCDQVELGTATLVGFFDFDTYDQDTIPFNDAGMYVIKIVHDSCYLNPYIWTYPVPAIAFNLMMKNWNNNTCPDFQEDPPSDNCKNCITSFSPTAGKYIVSAWVSEDGASMNTVTYENASIGISFTGDPALYTLAPTGRIIDGWQQIQQVIEVPAGATEIHLTLQSGGVDTYFDDIRFHPLDGSMVSYVYDPGNLRLMAKLDERNYATFYEYDEEGKLTRVKRETERGVMTIQENRDNIRKQ